LEFEHYLKPVLAGEAIYRQNRWMLGNGALFCDSGAKPLGGEEYLYLNLKYQLQSRLIIASWGQKPSCTQEYFVWKGERLTSFSKT
jgi:hypothetical protein